MFIILNILYIKYIRFKKQINSPLQPQFFDKPLRNYQHFFDNEPLGVLAVIKIIYNNKFK